MDVSVPCDPTTIAGWLAFLALVLIGVLHYLQKWWTEDRTKKKLKNPGRLPRGVVGTIQLLLIGAVGAMMAEAAPFGGALVNGVSNFVTVLGLQTSGTYAMGRGVIALLLAAGLAALWYTKPNPAVALLLAIMLPVLAGISPHMHNIISFVAEHVLTAVSGMVRWLSEREVQ